MQLFPLVLAGVLGVAAQAAQALELGHCDSRAALAAALAGEGQRVLLNAREGADGGRFWISASEDQSRGYVVQGKGTLCVTARVSQLRLGPAESAAQASAVQLPQLRAAARAVRSLKLGTVVRVGATEALAAPTGRGSVRPHDVAEQWSNAMYGFCEAGKGALMLCTTTHTAASR